MKGSKLLTLLRIKHVIFNGHRAPFLDFLFRIVFSFDIPASVEIGEGTQLPHLALGVIIHPKVRIGKNCKIFQNVTIGCRNGEGPPIIGNNVYIGAGAKILGKINVADNAKIGANSVVLKDIPANAVVVGIPGKIIKYN